MASAKIGTSSRPPKYRDEPGLDGDDFDALSMKSHPGQSNQVPIEFEDEDIDRHFQGADDIPDVLGEPPSYTDEADNEGPYSGQAPDENPHIFTPLKNKDGVDIIMDARFDQDAAYMEDCLRRWARTPPSQRIRILGTHTQTVKKDNKQSKETVTDFDIKLRLTEYLFNQKGTSSWAETITAENGDKTYRGTALKKRAKQDANNLEDGKPSLTEWCHRYCASHSKIKTFRLTREVTGLDTDNLGAMLTSLVKNTNYRGRVQVTFPIENRAIDVYSSSWQNRWRLNTWIALLFYISFLWLFTWPYLFFGTKKFHVIRVRWPYSIPANSESAGSAGGTRPEYATLSEGNWFKRWSKTIETNVCNKRQGMLTEEDLKAPDLARIPSTGNSSVDSAFNLIGAGVRAFSEVNRQLGWGGDC